MSAITLDENQLPGTLNAEAANDDSQFDSGGVEPEAHGLESETVEDFAEMLEKSESKRQVISWRKGDKLKVQVVRISDEWIFVNLGGKQEGAIRTIEFLESSDEDGEGANKVSLPAEGDFIEAYVLGSSGGEVTLTIRLGKKAASLAALETAREKGIPVQGRVSKAIKGGYEVKIGESRAFCPLSQIAVRWSKVPEEHLGKTYDFKVLEIKEKGRNIVVSRRALQDEAREKAREELKETLAPGSVVRGTVSSIQDFGAFVDIGGIDALIPVSQMSWGKVTDPREICPIGSQVSAQVIDIDWDKNRISLSLKALQEDPWILLASRFAPGQRVRGVVVRLAPFGAFVELCPGIDGLVHISAMGAGRRINHPREIINAGDEVEAEILSMDLEKRKISLSLESKEAETAGSLPVPDDEVEGIVESVAKFGVFVKLSSGRVGLVPNSEMGTSREADHFKMFKPGDLLKVVVLDVDKGGKRITLSRKALEKKSEKKVMLEYGESQPEKSFGTFGDIFREKLKKGS